MVVKSTYYEAIQTPSRGRRLPTKSSRSPSHARTESLGRACCRRHYEYLLNFVIERTQQRLAPVIL